MTARLAEALQQTAKAGTLPTPIAVQYSPVALVVLIPAESKKLFEAQRSLLEIRQSDRRRAWGCASERLTREDLKTINASLGVFAFLVCSLLSPSRSTIAFGHHGYL